MSAAAGNPSAYVRMQAGHSSGAITERYIHAAAVLFPRAAAKTQGRVFAALEEETAGARRAWRNDSPNPT